MQYFTLLFFGFLAAVLGVSLPGLLNMTAVKIAKEKGKKEVLYYVLGALVVIFIQTYIAIFFAKLIDSSSTIKEILHEVGLIIFGALTVYFLGFAKRKNKQKKEKPEKRGGAFVYGMFLAAVNVFSIPYYVFLSVTLSSYGYTIFKAPFTGIFSGGVVLGSALMFYIYVSLFRKKSVEETFVLRNINYIIGSITGIISLITVYKLLQ